MQNFESDEWFVQTVKVLWSLYRWLFQNWWECRSENIFEFDKKKWYRIRGNRVVGENDRRFEKKHQVKQCIDRLRVLGAWRVDQARSLRTYPAMVFTFSCLFLSTSYFNSPLFSPAPSLESFLYLKLPSASFTFVIHLLQCTFSFFVSQSSWCIVVDTLRSTSSFSYCKLVLKRKLRPPLYKHTIFQSYPLVSPAFLLSLVSITPFVLSFLPESATLDIDLELFLIVFTFFLNLFLSGHPDEQEIYYESTVFPAATASLHLALYTYVSHIDRICNPETFNAFVSGSE